MNAPDALQDPSQLVGMASVCPVQQDPRLLQDQRHARSAQLEHFLVRAMLVAHRVPKDGSLNQDSTAAHSVILGTNLTRKENAYPALPENIPMRETQPV